jgi:NAD(P)-dependent dehydrogenase (short-subunit alcohol dehydrogenase family)
MIRRGTGGVLLFTGSINALIPTPPALAYSVSKAGLDAFVRGLAVELGAHGIRVAGVHPGYIDTPLLEKVYSDPNELRRWKQDRESRVPLGRFADPDEVAAVFQYLASDAASYITGTSVVVDGGRVANVAAAGGGEN